MSKYLDKILREVSLDERVSNGTFNIEENDHMEALRDYLVGKGIDEESVKSFSNKVLEGKYPERQAYNANGILVTFPTPEYKKEAIKRGTHFEEDPTKQSSNLFQHPIPPPESITDKKPEKKPEKKSEPKDAPSEPKTTLPVSQAPPPEDADKSDQQPDVQAQTTAAPQQTPTPDVEPAPEKTELPPPPEKSPAEKEADKQAIKTMLKGDDYMLEQVIDWFRYNAPEYLKEQIETHLKKKL